jgi:Na+-translocating ferredoxin:NAD+ oxidoreductase RnfG subunit
MKIPILITAIIRVVLLAPLVLSAGVGEETESILRQVFPGADGFEFTAIELDLTAKKQAERASGQAFQMEKVFLWQIRDGADIIGFAVLDNVLGKVQPITYLAVYDSQLSIVEVQVIRYREQHGGAVQNLSWLDQFKGFASDSGFMLGEHIDGITGATLSANALTRGVKRMTVYLSLTVQTN